MANSFNISILTADKTVYEGRAVSLIVPSENGYLGILADHASLAANISSGKIILRKDFQAEAQIFHSQGRGFLQVLDNSAILLL